LGKKVVARAVSRSFRTAFDYHAPRHWHIVDFLKLRPHPSFFSSLLRNHGSGIRDLRCHVNLDDAALREVMENAPRLRALTLIEHECLVTESGLWHMAETCSPSLQSLSLETEAVRDSMLERLAERCPLLSELDLACPGQTISDASIVVVCHRCQGLTALNLEGQRITDASLRALASCPGLVSLNIPFCEADFGVVAITDHGLMPLARGCPRLTNLDLTCSNVTDQGLRVLAECCGDLELVNLTSCRDIVGHGVGELLTHCERLTELRLRSCDGISDQGVRSFAGKGERVTSIEIGGSWSSPLSDEALRDLARGCPELISLRLQCIDGITDEGIRRLVNEAASLHLMSIVSCELVTVEAAAYARSNGVSCPQTGLHEQTANGAFNNCVDLMCGGCFPSREEQPIMPSPQLSSTTVLNINIAGNM